MPALPAQVAQFSFHFSLMKFAVMNNFDLVIDFIQ